MNELFIKEWAQWVLSGRARGSEVHTIIVEPVEGIRAKQGV